MLLPSTPALEPTRAGWAPTFIFLSASERSPPLITSRCSRKRTPGDLELGF
jgi:hypothetical protein